MLHLNTNHSTSSLPEVRYHSASADESYCVQVFLGDSYHSMYMDAETARSFAERILAAVPAVEVVAP